MHKPNRMQRIEQISRVCWTVQRKGGNFNAMHSQRSKHEAFLYKVFYDKLAVTSKHVLIIIVTGHTVLQIVYMFSYCCRLCAAVIW